MSFYDNVWRITTAPSWLDASDKVQCIEFSNHIEDLVISFILPYDKKGISIFAN